MQLSKRLKMIADMADTCEVICDIGTDHGYIPIYLVENAICKKSLACDVVKGPLLAAQKHIKEAGLEEKIDTLLGDGLTPVKPGYANEAVIAGMGGILITKILLEGEDTAKSMGALILSPHSEYYEFRSFLYDNGYETIREDMVKDLGKYYVAIKVKPNVAVSVAAELKDIEEKADLFKKADISDTKENILKAYLTYGKCLIYGDNETFIMYLHDEYDKLQKLINTLNNAGQDKRKEEVMHDISINRLALKLRNVSEIINS